MKYQGPADTFQLEEGGKVYRQGDNVPISKELATLMGQSIHGAHRFEGMEAPLPAPPPAPVPTEEPMPTDERGQAEEPRKK